MIEFFSTPMIYHVDFGTIGVTLLIVSLLFPIFDKLTQKSVEEFDCLIGKVRKSKGVSEKDADAIETEIEVSQKILL